MSVQKKAAVIGPCQGNRAASFLSREVSGKKGYGLSASPYLSCLQSEGTYVGSGLIRVEPTASSLPAYCARYNLVAVNRQLVAVADEEGYVSIIDTSQTLPETLDYQAAQQTLPCGQWIAHHNAIFDVAWAHHDEVLLAASGDQTISKWDTPTAKGLGTFHGHQGSVKTISVSSDRPQTMASGARDGMLCLWDLRQGKPIQKVENAHAPEQASKLRRPRKAVRQVVSVTSVLFIPGGDTLATGGADGAVKLWDLRSTLTPFLTIHPPREEEDTIYPYSDARRQHGITSLDVDSRGSRLLVSVMNGCNHVYSTFSMDKGPFAQFSGHNASSFYIKSAFCGDGTHIASGSSDKDVCIWEVDKPSRQPCVRLKGHSAEVTCVAWCPTNPHQITSCGDDSTVRVWGLRRGTPKEVQDSQRVQHQPEPEPVYIPHTQQLPPGGFVSPDPLRSPLGARLARLLQGISQSERGREASASANLFSSSTACGRAHGSTGGGVRGCGSPGCEVAAGPSIPFPLGEIAAGQLATPAPRGSKVIEGSSRKKRPPLSSGKQTSLKTFFSPPPLTAPPKSARKQPEGEGGSSGEGQSSAAVKVGPPALSPAAANPLSPTAAERELFEAPLSPRTNLWRTPLRDPRSPASPRSVHKRSLGSLAGSPTPKRCKENQGPGRSESSRL